jgi:hypothetical protein
LVISKDCGKRGKRLHVFLASHQAGICTAPGFCGKFGLPDALIEVGQNPVYGKLIAYDEAQHKVRFLMISRASCMVISLVALLGLSSVLDAQRAKAPSLEEILERLEANLDRYDTGVPSFFCDEHVISSQTEPSQRDENTVTDSVFRLKRTPNTDHTTTLVESREVKSVNGKPTISQDIDGPTLLNGAFEGGLAVVSPNQTPCINYDLQRINRNRPTEPYVVRFATVLTPQNAAKCLLQENSKGRAVIDADYAPGVDHSASHDHCRIPVPIAHHRRKGHYGRLCAGSARQRDLLDAHYDQHARHQRCRNLSRDSVAFPGELSRVPQAGGQVAYSSCGRGACAMTSAITLDDGIAG